MQLPEQGQLVQVRNRHYAVGDVAVHDRDGHVVHRVTLECLDDDLIGETLEVIWQREVNSQVFDTSQLPTPADWDPAETFQAFTDAVRWSSSSVVEGPELQGAFHGAIEIADYQLLPAARALRMPRVSLLIADDVGLGKTIEAALVMRELIARRHVRRVMVVCPASLQRQWQEEMAGKFNLEFRVIDSRAVEGLRKEYGVHVNPWNGFPRLITSMDFIKRESPKQLFQQSLRRGQAHAILRDWDLLIVDEVHNCAPSGRGSYPRASDRTRMLRDIAPHFEHRLFLTATPHNGYTQSFTALLEVLDPLRFSRGDDFDRDVLQRQVMIRRMKDQITDDLGGRKFPKREVPALPVTVSDTTAQDLLDNYVRSRMDRADDRSVFAVQFALTLLKKRFLSSPLAFWRSLQTHMRMPEGGEQAADIGLVRRMKERADEDWDDDEEKTQHEDAALQEASRFFAGLAEQERLWLAELHELAKAAAGQPDEKVHTLCGWIETNVVAGGAWNAERVIVFTEYRDTLAYLEQIVAQRRWGEHVLTLYGGMATDQREAVKKAFQAPPDETPVRILLATDAASEGLNLQNHCRNIIHYEIPWNPNRMEQRNGRIDRYGQKAENVVRCYHFWYTNNEDQRFLDVVVSKVETQRADLGSVGDVIADEVEKAVLGLTDRIADPQERRKRQEADLQSELLAGEETRALHNRLLQTRAELGLHPERMAAVLDAALRLAKAPGLKPVSAGELAGKAFDPPTLPPAWAECAASLKSAEGHRLRLVFDHELARDRKDVALIHLSHPLMKRAIATFRANLWQMPGADGALHRCSYRVLADRLLPHPAVIALGRAVAVSGLGEKLHEALLHAGGSIHDTRLTALEPDQVAGLLSASHEYPHLPTSLGVRLRQLFPAHRQRLERMLADLEAQETRRVTRLLRDKGAEVSREVRRLCGERIRELEKRIAQARTARERAQLALFSAEDLGEYEDDVRWWERRLQQLQAERETEPDRAAKRYELRSLRVFPLGVLYLLPESLLEGGGA